MFDEREKKQDIDEAKFGYVLIGFTILVLYIVTISYYVRFCNWVIPRGDPFTYTNGFFMLLDRADANYFATFHYVFSSSWYWLLNGMIAFFSPILVKEPFSFSLVNFVMWGLAVASFYRLVRYFKLGSEFSFIAAWILMLFPINYGFLTYSSIPVMGLDAMFLGALHVAIANMIIFVIDPGKKRNACLAGICVGLVVWGRGNSLPVVIMVIFCPLILILYKLWQEKIVRVYLNFLIFLSISTSMAICFYITNWQRLSGYYVSHVTFVTRHQWNLNDAMMYIKNIPGFFFWRFEDSIVTIAMSFFLHSLVLFSVYMTFRSDIDLYKKKICMLFSITGAFIYFGTYFINILLFTDPLMNIYNCLLIYAPMRIGITLSIIAMLTIFVLKNNIKIKQWTIFPIIFFVIIFGAVMTKIQTPKPIPGVPTPVEIESFAKNIDGLLGKGTISILWYRHYNPNILRYYRLKNDLPDANIYRGKYYDDIWWPHDYSEKKRMMVREELKDHFENATMIVIPEYVDSYGLQNPYSFYQFRDEFPRYLNSPDAPRFVVRMLLYDYYDNRLLVLQRESEAKGLGEPLKLPYGPSINQQKEDYGANVVKWYEKHSQK